MTMPTADLLDARHDMIEETQVGRLEDGWLLGLLFANAKQFHQGLNCSS